MNTTEFKKFLFDGAVKVLEAEGWQVTRIPGAGKSSVRRITKDGVSSTVSIRTSRDTWIAFPRNAKDSGWDTLDEVDYVVASSMDDAYNPKKANVHMIPADEMRERFNRAYDARKKAGLKIKPGHGVWVSLYSANTRNKAYHDGEGAGLDHPALASIPLEQTQEEKPGVTSPDQAEPPLTIAEAKRRLALSLGVDVSDIKITISS